MFRYLEEGFHLSIKKMCRTGNNPLPPVLGILVLGILCIISGFYFAFFSAGISYLASHPLHLSPFEVFGNLLIFAGIILLLIGSYRQKNSPAY